MFEAAQLGQKISRSAYKKRLPVLRGALLDVQQRLRDAPFPGTRRLRRGGWRGEGRNRQPAERVDGSAVDRHSRLWRALGRGTRASGTLAVLARAPAGGAYRALPEFLVLAARPRARLPADFACRVRAPAAAPRGIRKDARRQRRAHPEVLDAPRQAGAAHAAEDTRKEPADRLAGHQPPVEALEAVRPLHRRGRAGDRHDQHGAGAVDDCRRPRRAVSQPHGRRNTGAGDRGPAFAPAVVQAENSAAAPCVGEAHAPARGDGDSRGSTCRSESTSGRSSAGC